MGRIYVQRLRRAAASASLKTMLRLAPLALLLIPSPAAADEKTFMIAGFDRIRVEGPFTVRVVSGTSPKARTVGDARAIDGVRVRASGRTLIVAASLNAWGGYPGARAELPVVEITAVALRSAAVVGGGSVTIDRMRGQSVDLSVTGAGSLSVGTLDADRFSAILVGTGSLSVGGTARDARFQSNGAGRIDAVRLVATQLTVGTQGSGESSFTASGTAAVSASGLGGVTVRGDATCTVRGSAPVTCGKDRPAR